MTFPTNHGTIKEEILYNIHYEVKRMKMFKKSLALLFALLLCCTTLCSIFSVYAEDVEYGDNDIPCWDPEEEPAYKGDVNEDGIVSAADYNDIKKIVFKLSSYAYYEVADINNDGELTASDLNDLKRYVFKILSNEEAEELGFPPYNS